MSEWISVEDRLPVWYERVFVWAEAFKMPIISRRVETGYKDKNGESKWRWDFSLYTNLIDVGVKYWMPLPAPPENDNG